jgi:NAD(P)-dependent dehydrogenase (short-subunit alcohol dehydrogenase family)
MQLNMDLLKKYDLKDQVAVVTGGAGLLGRQFCRALAQTGARVVCADISLGSTNDWVKELNSQGLNVSSFQMDVTKPEENQAMAVFVEKEFKRLDILVTCAAIDPKFDKIHSAQFDYSFEKYPLESWQKTLNVNLTGAFLSAQVAIPLMLKNNNGVMVMVSSMYGLIAPDQRIYQTRNGRSLNKPADYPVTKAGILALVKYLAAYYSGQPIRVNALSPGGVYNGQSDEFVKNYSDRSPLGRMANAEEMNAALLFLASPASSYMNGANLVVDGGWTAW